MKLLKFFFLALCAVVTFSCTSDEPSDPDSGQEISPDEKVPDPTGTVLLSMRDKNNGETYLPYDMFEDGILIENENFTSSAYQFIDLGPVSGLGNVTYIPKEGWAEQVMVVPGHGYVAYKQPYNNYAYAQNRPKECYRIYVVDYAYSTSGGIIGADIKYQKTFFGIDQDLIIDKSEIVLKASEFNHYTGYGSDYYEIYPRVNVNILNNTLTFFTESYSNKNLGMNFNSSHLNYMCLNYIRIDGSYFRSLSTLSSITEIDNIIITTGYGKSKTVKVYFDPENQVDTNIVDTNIDTTGKKFIYLVGSITGWTTPSEENASFYEDYKLYDLEDNGIYTGTFYIGDGGGIFRFYKTLTGWQGGSSYGSQEADIPVDVVFNNGVYIGPATAGKGSWNISNGWSGGNLSISVDTNNNLVTFNAL